VEFDDMVNLIQRFEVYWSEINRTPSAPRVQLPLQPEPTLG